MIQSHASIEIAVFRSNLPFVWVMGWMFVLISLVMYSGGRKVPATPSGPSFSGIVLDRKTKLGIEYGGHDVGNFWEMKLNGDGELRLSIGHPAGTFTYPQMFDTLKLEWWQIVEREDGFGYPRIDPQSGGSGLPGAKGEDEDPAYYSKENLADAELRKRIFAEGKYWLVDKPSLENSIRCESWLVERTGPKAVTFITGVTWGITAEDGKPLKLHHPQQIARRSRYDWHESLRISGFGNGWDIKSAYHSTLP